MMGFIGDLNKLSKQAKEINKTWDPGAQMQDTLDRMKALNESMAEANKAMTDGVPGTATVVTVGPSAGMMNMNPMMQVDLLVTQQGGMPRPVSQQLVVPMQHLARLQVGATLAVLVSQSDPSNVAIMWDQPVVS
jgi:hypothetical protein